MRAEKRDSSYTGRYCVNFYCDAYGDRRCCADCIRKKRRECRNPCLNDPRRCNLVDERERTNAGYHRRG